MGHFQKKVAKNRFNWYKALGVSQTLQDQLTKQGQEPPLPNKVGMSPQWSWKTLVLNFKIGIFGRSLMYLNL